MEWHLVSSLSTAQSSSHYHSDNQHDKIGRFRLDDYPLKNLNSGRSERNGEFVR